MATHPIVVLLICSSLLHTATGFPSDLLSRKSTREDPYLICDDPPPVSNLPPNYLTDWYPTTLALCSALNGAARNVGCICYSSTGYVHCDQRLADQTLYTHRVPSTPFPRSRLQPLNEYCSDACYCADVNSARRARGSTASTTSSSSQTATASQQAATARIQGVINVPYDVSGPNPFSSLTSQRFSVTADATENAQNGGGSRWANQCGSNCTSVGDCAGGGGNCTCLAAQKGTFQPGIGTMAFVAACIVSMASSGGGVGGGIGGGGKRDVGGGEDAGRACPCNSSYVSRGCCGARDGLVWEGPEFKLGELVERGG